MNAPHHAPVSRRDLLVSSACGFGLAALATAIPASALLRGPVKELITPRKRSLRVAHLTDMHIQPERSGDVGVAACFQHVQSQPDRPHFILTGGDTIMDGFASDQARTQLQWNLWNTVSKKECSIPMLSALGNHDIWGWNKGKSKSAGDEKGWGKAWACEQFGREKPYTSTTRDGWHFIILDSIQIDKDDPNGYESYLDDAQFDWLSADLAAHGGTPTLIVSHAPIVSATVFDGAGNDEKGNLRISGGLMHKDCGRIINLFKKHPHVKACLSGHVHLVDHVHFNGVQYFCNGAVSGGWWKGDHKTCKPGYAMLNLYDDGTLSNEYVPYGWVARE